jgi:histone-lysine N-methyltransferase SETMAR
MTTQRFEQSGWKVLQHPPHSPDPAPSDFHISGHPKWSSSEQQFQTDKNVDAS